MATQKKISTDEVKTVFDNTPGGAFCHYQTMNSLDDMCRERCFFVQQLARQNDKQEKKYYSEEISVLFPLCFCRSDNEKLPLWLLYGGIDFKGTRLKITPVKLRDFVISIINGESKVFASKKGKDNIVRIDNELIYGKDIEIVALGSVGYNNEQVSYNNKWYNKLDDTKTLPSIEVGDKEIDLKYLYKEYIWVYEKEFRVVFKLIGEKAKIADPKKNGITGIGIKWSDNLAKNIEIMLSPKNEKVDATVIDKHDGIKNWLFEKIQLSQYNGQIDMDLKENMCNRCLCRRRLTGKLKKMYKKTRFVSAKASKH